MLQGAVASDLPDKLGKIPSQFQETIEFSRVNTRILADDEIAQAHHSGEPFAQRLIEITVFHQTANAFAVAFDRSQVISMDQMTRKIDNDLN